MNSKIKLKGALFFLALTSLLTFSCGQKDTQSENEAVEAETEENPNMVELTSAQYEASGIATGGPEMKSLSGTLKVNGFVDVPPENLYSITTQMGGIVKSVSVLQGSTVGKGKVIAVLENQDYVLMQQDYLESSSQLELAETEYQRQLELSKENINAQKILQQAKAQRQTMLARTNALRQRLKLINIDANTLNSGNIRSTMNIYAPASGYITKVNINVGKFVAPNDVMMELVSSNSLHIELKVFEKDVSKLAVGQQVRFILNNETEERMAKIVLVGKEVGPDKTVTVHCIASDNLGNLIPNTYLRAFIETGSNKVTALPETGVVDYLGKKYIFVEKSEQKGGAGDEKAPKTTRMHTFEMLEVTTGLQEAGYVEVKLPEGIDTAAIVKTGAYDVLSKMKNSEEEE
ncbi:MULTISPECIES: efflux RND transporter periplasmic adaptor subunit [Olivibacter]|uniref:Efflux RND transporter periplasmic adaptor subunit n=1 Tax=Olivibacter oleidegradans TaxID=760123 RepID=A0ABV6HKQ1_9SPHI|nr:efflux RND transporter periplasmic adaptor subunit [Olivibacter jilunii]